MGSSHSTSYNVQKTQKDISSGSSKAKKTSLPDRHREEITIFKDNVHPENIIDVPAEIKGTSVEAAAPAEKQEPTPNTETAEEKVTKKDSDGKVNKKKIEIVEVELTEAESRESAIEIMPQECFEKVTKNDGDGKVDKKKIEIVEVELTKAESRESAIEIMPQECFEIPTSSKEDHDKEVVAEMIRRVSLQTSNDIENTPTHHAIPKVEHSSIISTVHGIEENSKRIAECEIPEVKKTEEVQAILESKEIDVIAEEDSTVHGIEENSKRISECEIPEDKKTEEVQAILESKGIDVIAEEDNTTQQEKSDVNNMNKIHEDESMKVSKINSQETSQTEEALKKDNTTEVKDDVIESVEDTVHPKDVKEQNITETIIKEKEGSKQDEICYKEEELKEANQQESGDSKVEERAIIHSEKITPKPTSEDNLPAEISKKEEAEVTIEVHHMEGRKQSNTKIEEKIEQASVQVENAAKSTSTEEVQVEKEAETKIIGTQQEIKEAPKNAIPEIEQTESIKVEESNVSKPELQNEVDKPEEVANSLEDHPSVKQIKAVEERTNFLREKVIHFSGSTKSGEYIDLKEALIKNLIKLDDISVHNNEELRNVRKRVIKLVQECLDTLERNVVATEDDKDSDSDSD